MPPSQLSALMLSPVLTLHSWHRPGWCCHLHPWQLCWAQAGSNPKRGSTFLVGQMRAAVRTEWVTPGEPGLWPTPFPSRDPSHWQGYRSDPTRCSKRPGTTVFVTLSHEVRGQDSPFPAAHPKLPLVILLLCPAQGPGGWVGAVPGPPHLSRRKRTKATRRAAREMQWPR